LVQKTFDFFATLTVFDFDLYNILPLDCIFPHEWTGFQTKLIVMMAAPVVVALAFVTVAALVAVRLYLLQRGERNLSTRRSEDGSERTEASDISVQELNGKTVTLCKLWRRVLGSPHCWNVALTLWLIFYPTLARFVLSTFDAAPVCTDIMMQGDSQLREPSSCTYYLAYDTRIVAFTWRGEHLVLSILALFGVVVYCAGVPLGFLWAVHHFANERLARFKQKRVSLLVGGYRYEQRFFEAVEMLRRLLLTSVVTIFLPGSMEQLWLGTMGSAAFTIFYVRLQPYSDPYLMYLQTMCMTSLLFIYLTASLFVPQSQFTGPTNPESFGDGVLYINLTVLACVCIAMTHTLCATSFSVSAMRMIYAADRTGVVLTIPHDDGFHIFLSHVWKWAQDQAATVKAMLVTTVPTTRAFLDVRPAWLAASICLRDVVAEHSA
jgi:hypothetical protein